MTQEEKAKAYDEAFEDMRIIYPNLKGDAKLAVEHAFPQLRESEDEKIRKWLVDYFTEIGENWIHREFTCKQIVDYIEKQKEQPKEELVYRLNDLMQEYIKEGKDEAEKEFAEAIKTAEDHAYFAGSESMREKVISTIESRISEILGDAQPAPILRAELRELIDKFK